MTINNKHHAWMDCIRKMRGSRRIHLLLVVSVAFVGVLLTLYLTEDREFAAHFMTHNKSSPQALSPRKRSAPRVARPTAVTALKHAAGRSSVQRTNVPVATRSVTKAEERNVAAVSSSSVFESVAAIGEFPPMLRTVHPVGRIPNWGVMKTPQEWNRVYGEYRDDEYVQVPPYNLQRLTIPFAELTKDLKNPENQRLITEKLYYSTRFFADYDLDAVPFGGSNIHPGNDLKLPKGTPLGSIAGGRVLGIFENKRLGTHVIVEHRHPTDGIYFSVYGHLDSASVRAGQDVTPGTIVGRVGTSGQTLGAPHVHLEVHIAQNGIYQEYKPPSMPSRAEAAMHVLDPITFMARYAGGVEQTVTKR